MNNIKFIAIRDMLKLWQSYGYRKVQGNGVEWGITNGWPFKIWINRKEKCFQDFAAEIANLTIQYPGFSFCFWDVGENSCQLVEQITKPGMYSPITSLQSMHLRMDYFSYRTEDPVSTKTNIVPVRQSDVELWCHYCSLGFNYNVDPEAVSNSLKDISNRVYFLLFNGNVCGGVLIRKEYNVMGIHQYFVLPELRGNGLARIFLQKILTEDASQDVTLSVLQASSMGIGLYKKFGFVNDFELYSIKLLKEIWDPCE